MYIGLDANVTGVGCWSSILWLKPELSTCVSTAMTGMQYFKGIEALDASILYNYRVIFVHNGLAPIECGFAAVAKTGEVPKQHSLPDESSLI